MRLPEALGVGGLVVFAWLVLSRGDWLAAVGGVLGLPALIVVVFGVVWSLLADSSFANADTRRFPRRSRALLWIGYLVLSLSLLNWLEHSHRHASTAHIDAGFFLLGIPVAAWLAIRRPFSAAATAQATATAPDESGQSVESSPTAAARDAE